MTNKQILSIVEKHDSYKIALERIRDRFTHNQNQSERGLGLKGKLDEIENIVNQVLDL